MIRLSLVSQMFSSDVDHLSTTLLMTSHAPGDSICQHNAYLELCAKLSEAFLPPCHHRWILDNKYMFLINPPWMERKMNWQDGGCTSLMSNLNVSLNSQIGPISHNMRQLSFTWLAHNLTALGVSRDSTTAPTAVF